MILLPIGYPSTLLLLGRVPSGVAYAFFLLLHISQLETKYLWYARGGSLFIWGSEMFMIS
jgi:hypothetical protein